MARIRTIKPEFSRDKRLFDMERESGLPIRAAYPGLWTAADRDGRFEWDPHVLKLDSLPYDDVDFAAVLDVFVKHGRILKYDVNGRIYGCIVQFRKHQNINNKERKSQIPPPDEKLLNHAYPEMHNHACRTRAPKRTTTRDPECTTTRDPRCITTREPECTTTREPRVGGDALKRSRGREGKEIPPTGVSHSLPVEISKNTEIENSELDEDADAGKGLSPLGGEPLPGSACEHNPEDGDGPEDDPVEDYPNLKRPLSRRGQRRKPINDPYAGMTFEERKAAVVREFQEFRATLEREAAATNVVEIIKPPDESKITRARPSNGNPDDFGEGTA